MGNWDEHLAVQTILQDFVEESGVDWLTTDVAAFLLGVAQHEMYDLIVNERPIQVQRIDFLPMNALQDEMPSIYLNMLGIGLSLWRTLKWYSVNRDKEELRRRLLGLLGAVTPDLLEALRLAMLSDPVEAWMQGDADTFHLAPDGWKHPMDTFQNPWDDLTRRMILQNIALMLPLFHISF